jgi:transposase
MYPRIVKVKDRHGKPLEYVRLVESYREGDRVRQRTVANLGRKDLLEDHLDRIVKLIRRGEKKSTLPEDGEVTAPSWGPVVVARYLWEHLELDKIVRRLCSSPNARYDIAELAFVLVASRLCRPSSEHALAWWLEEAYVCDRRGQRFLPQWKQRGRVRVDFNQLNLWYRTIDRLLEKKDEIEKSIYLRLRDLFSLKVQMAFYDLTSTYFEGRGPRELARHGYSRDHRPREKQVLVGVVMANGWPIAHHVFRGNLKDQQTVKDVLKDLRERFGLERVTFVGDRGMVSKEILNWLEKEKVPYLVALQRRRRPQVVEIIEKAKGPWKRCSPSQFAQEQNEPPMTYVREVKGKDKATRHFVVKSDERLEYEREQRKRSMERTREGLDNLKRLVSQRKLRKPEVIGAKAQAILNRNHGHRYFDWKLRKGGVFEYFEHPVNLAREKAIEGKYVLTAWNVTLDGVGAVEAYKELSEVERGFRHLKDVIELRPVYHQKAERVRGHIFIAALSFLLFRALEKLLRQAGVDLGTKEAMQALETVRVVEFEVDGQPHQIVTRPSGYAARVLKALGIRGRKPPRPEQSPGAM